MVIERTEKAASDITKHEMVARFVMESRTIRAVKRMPFIRELSKKVEEKCPDLKLPIAILLLDLEKLLITLEKTKDLEKQEEILANIAQEVTKFNIEACKSLPLPNILQVIQTWLHIECQVQLLKDDIKKKIGNVELFQAVVDCLHEEKITPEEAKVIARALYEDKSLKKIFLLNNSEIETEIDSQSQSQSLQAYGISPKQSTAQQSLHVSSAFKLPSPIPQIEPDNITQSFTFDPAFLPPSPNHQKLPDASLNDSFNPSSPEEPVEDIQQYKISDDIQDLGVLNPLRSYLFKPSVEQQPGTKDSCTKSPEQEPNPIPLSSSDSDSSEITSAASSTRNRKRWKKLLEDLRLEEDFSESGSPSVSKKTETPKVVEDIPVQNLFVSQDDEEDSSDCDKNTDFRFLTPTMFKSNCVEKRPDPVVELSDNESFNSSITTNPKNSQKDDPTFKVRHPVVVPERDSPVLPSRKKLKTSLMKTKNRNPNNRILARITEQPSPEIPRQMTLRRFGFASNSTNTKSAAQHTTEPSKTFKLFDNDIPVTRSSDESSLFEKDLNQNNKKQNPQQKTVKSVYLSNKRRCEECKKVFKTPSELRKHVFIVHTVEDLSDD